METVAAILKNQPTDAAVGPSGLTGLNLDDFTATTKQLLARANEQAAEIIRNANQEAQAIRQQASQEGRQEGLTAGREELEGQIQKRINVAVRERLTVLETAAANMRTAQADWLESLRETISALAVAIAEKVILHRLAKEPEIVTRWTEQALEHVRAAETLVVAVHPETLVKVAQPLEALLQAAGVSEDSRIEPDETLEPFGVVLRQPGGSVDARLSSQLSLLAEMLQ